MIRNSITVNLNAIKKNYIEIKHRAGNCSVAAVIKANAYGHGAVRVAKALIDVGCDFFAVASLSEAVQLRENGVSGNIIILGVTPIDFCEPIIKYDLIQTVPSYEYAAELAKRYSGARVHIKIDTGMSRLGFYCHSESDVPEALEAIKPIYKLPLSAEGIFTHFAESDEPQSDYTEKQFSAFMAIIDALEKDGINVGIRHCANSGAIFNYPETRLDMVRAGIVLYGLAPSHETPVPGLIPAMDFSAAVMQVHKLEKGESVSYGRRFVASEPMEIAAISVGYADGYTRLLSSRDQVLIHGKRARVIGNICMDITLLDVTGLEVKPGDTAVVFGKSEGVYKSVDELADLVGTINYEFLCSIGRRAERVYIE